MRTDPSPAKRRCLAGIVAVVLQVGCIVATTIVGVVTVIATPHSDDGQTLLVRVEAPESDILKAVQEVTQDQIIHGTYSYEKERILYGAHSADAARAFGVWKGPGRAFYKVANKVLSPRFFKDSEDIGTISVRYVVQDAGSTGASLQIDAIFVDARNVRHPSLGNVESSEYAVIQQHLKTIQEGRRQAEEAKAVNAATPVPSAIQAAAGLPLAESSSDSSIAGLSAPELQKQVETLRHQVELRVKDPGAALKAAPFQSSTTLVSLPGATEVLVQVLTAYWYGVETEDGHHGWIHHSQLEPLP
jgi:hypothetical protein